MQSGSFNVIDFAINYRPTKAPYRHIILLDLPLKFPKQYSHPNRQKLLSSITPLSFDAPPRGTPANIRIHLIIQELELESLAYIFAADSMGLSSFTFYRKLQKTHLFRECVPVVQSHPRSIVPIESAYATSY